MIIKLWETSNYGKFVFPQSEILTWRRKYFHCIWESWVWWSSLHSTWTWVLKFSILAPVFRYQCSPVKSWWTSQICKLGWLLSPIVKNHQWWSVFQNCSLLCKSPTQRALWKQFCKLWTRRKAEWAGSDNKVWLSLGRHKQLRAAFLKLPLILFKIVLHCVCTAAMSSAIVRGLLKLSQGN